MAHSSAQQHSVVAGAAEPFGPPILNLKSAKTLTVLAEVPIELRCRCAAAQMLKMPSHRRKKKASTAAADFRDNNVGRSLPINEYAGWRVPAPNTKIDIVDVSSITPEQFWAEYVSQRKPVSAAAVDLIAAAAVDRVRRQAKQ
jgi:hypothetical protein